MFRNGKEAVVLHVQTSWHIVAFPPLYSQFPPYTRTRCDRNSLGRVNKLCFIEKFIEEIWRVLSSCFQILPLYTFLLLANINPPLTGK